ncbi:hypothetical protein F8154_03220 [Alkaliphilus pronyensis]|uniref:DNRLRE domain-containing protein n=1 Tax=Alkaliphilus pronyensis TaxID=1482732 RepID=A0A6I0F5Z1_9FIRM|nr:hypothetical protein [Alkaliphilus pronyensis]KAB3537315.1 hypothetical protein F8154_03220 [Alkaliphilus pronyensis]
MTSLEKKMFFIPKNLAVRKDRLYISFNLSVIPKDMKVLSIQLHIPFHNKKKPKKTYIKELTSDWSPKKIRDGINPNKSKVLIGLQQQLKENELIIDTTLFKDKWRLSNKNNYGIYVRITNDNLSYLINNPPYLVIDTI